MSAAMTPWQPTFGVLDPFRKEMKKSWNGSSVRRTGRRGPTKTGLRVDVEETDKEILVKADLPGVDPKNIEITVENGVLMVRGEKKRRRKRRKRTTTVSNGSPARSTERSHCRLVLTPRRSTRRVPTALSPSASRRKSSAAEEDHRDTQGVNAHASRERQRPEPTRRRSSYNSLRGRVVRSDA